MRPTSAARSAIAEAPSEGVSQTSPLSCAGLNVVSQAANLRPQDRHVGGQAGPALAVAGGQAAEPRFDLREALLPRPDRIILRARYGRKRQKCRQRTDGSGQERRTNMNTEQPTLHGQMLLRRNRAGDHDPSTAYTTSIAGVSSDRA